VEGERDFLRARDVMFASESQSPVIMSIGSVGWLLARERRACRRSEAEPEAPGWDVSCEMRKRLG
jgi:hypothetical protein